MSLEELPAPVLPRRDPRGHKGTFGTVAVVGGCGDPRGPMVGAPALAALGALRAGAGLVKVSAPETILGLVLGLVPSATGRGIPCRADGLIEPHDAAEAVDRAAAGADCLVVGPGLGPAQGRSLGTQTLALRAVQQHDVPVVIDADAINGLAQLPELLRDFHAAAVLTPHPGEFRRLAESLAIEADPVEPGARSGAAEELARRLGCIVVLKGAGTVVTDGHRTWVCAWGSAALATAGTGDVLAGVIGGLIGQFVTPHEARPWPMPAAPRPAGRPLDLFDAARLGVAIHARAGDLWCERRGASAGLLAMELAELIPEAAEELRGA